MTRLMACNFVFVVVNGVFNRIACAGSPDGLICGLRHRAVADIIAHASIGVLHLLFKTGQSIVVAT